MIFSRYRAKLPQSKIRSIQRYHLCSRTSFVPPGVMYVCLSSRSCRHVFPSVGRWSEVNVATHKVVQQRRALARAASVTILTSVAFPQGRLEESEGEREVGRTFRIESLVRP